MSKRREMLELAKDKPAVLDRDMFYGMRLDDEQYNFASEIWSPDKDIIFCDSCAGTGKTTVAVGVANMLVQYGDFRQIVYIMFPYGERKQGWLPGTITEKSSVYFEPLYQALITCNVNPNIAINNESMVNQKMGDGYVTCITDTYLRGPNLDNAVIIIDEAQNGSLGQLKKVLTRVGKSTKTIVIGHTLQCDLENPLDSGFAAYIEHFRSQERAAVCTLLTNHRGWVSSWADALKF